ncbi:MAG: UbiX family flavin prenyltransferase [Desulfovibrio sp.]|jgi:4-hydroxy-3-polyprenylbenzoate decarboxylase|nr:UbiX family flavin prenyltransferase [Desulfovibrio sp.]
MKLLVGVSGASGSAYAVALLREAVRLGCDVHAVFSRWGAEVLRLECGLDPEDFPDVDLHDPDEMSAPPASGSTLYDGMVILPCSMHTLACTAHGMSFNLLQRAAGVMLKEKRTLVLVPRETPLSVVHLENMLTLARAGALILPASPAFYHKPRDLNALVNQVAGKVLNALGLQQDLFPAWSAPEGRSRAGAGGGREKPAG